jgi:hypothetical protein
MKVQESRGRFWITIPKTKIKIKKWSKGQEVDWSFDRDGNLVLQEVKK